MRASDRAWVVLAAGIVTYEVAAKPEELMSEAVDRYLDVTRLHYSPDSPAGFGSITDVVLVGTGKDCVPDILTLGDDVQLGAGKPRMPQPLPVPGLFR